MKKEVKVLLDTYSIIGESLFEILERPQVVRNRFGGLMVELNNILASHGVAVGPVTSNNTGSPKLPDVKEMVHKYVEDKSTCADGRDMRVLSQFCKFVYQQLRAGA